MKRLFCCLLMLSVLFSLAACGEEAPGVTPSVPQNPGNSTLEISGLLTDGDCAMVVGDYRLSTVSLCYYFQDIIMEFYDNESFIPSDDPLDPVKPLNEQMVDTEDDITWADYFLDKAFQRAKRDLMLYGMAKADGWTLPEPYEKELDSTMENLEETAALYGYPNADVYLRSYYSPDSNAKNYRAYLQLQAIADGYYNWHLQSLTYDDAALRAYENDKYHHYTTYIYDCVYLSASYFSGGKEALQAAADVLVTARTSEELESKMNGLTVKEGAVLSLVHAQTLLSEMLTFKALTDWLSDPQRKDGDIAAIADTSSKGQLYGYEVVMFKGKNENKETMGNVRHLLVKFDSNTVTEEVRSAAREKAEGYLNTWRTGAATEEYFIELVKAHSQDGYLENGGLYENIHPGSNYVTPFKDWATDPARVQGDTGIIETDYGCHVMYYVGDSTLTCRDYLITNELANKEHDSWYEAALTAVTAEFVSSDGIPMDLVISPE